MSPRAQVPGVILAAGIWLNSAAMIPLIYLQARGPNGRHCEVPPDRNPAARAGTVAVRAGVRRRRGDARRHRARCGPSDARRPSPTPSRDCCAVGGRVCGSASTRGYGCCGFRCYHRNAFQMRMLSLRPWWRTAELLAACKRDQVLLAAAPGNVGRAAGTRPGNLAAGLRDCLNSERRERGAPPTKAAEMLGHTND